MIPYRDSFPDIYSEAEKSTLDGAQLRLLLLAEICDTKDEMIVSTRQIKLSEIFDSLESQCIKLSSSRCQLVAILICGCTLENKNFGQKLFYLKETHAKNFRSWNRSICSLPSEAASSISGFSLILDWVIVLLFSSTLEKN